YLRHNSDEKVASKKFDPQEMVDAYLLEQLAAVRDELTRGEHKLDVETAHAFLGRLLFTSYLVDRGIVILSEDKYFPNQDWKSLRELLSGEPNEVFDRLYKHLFPQLKRDFNGSMFDVTGLDAERAAVHPSHLKTVRDFFDGHEIGRNQRTLGFWAYDFRFIPVETISAIYENFLEKENVHGKRQDGAYYTPRFLAEMTLDIALEGGEQLAQYRYLDGSCGSGIFLVLLFNRLAAEWTSKNQTISQRNTSAAYRKKDRALRTALGSLRGVDKNATACRVACFSLYLAFLDHFSPSDIRTYIQQSETNKLPNLLQHQDSRAKKPDIPVIWHADFFALAQNWGADDRERFDYIVGNPPWAGRGKKQIAQEFMIRIPELLRENGKAALLLPTKIFFNETDAFQHQWLRAVTLEKVVQLSDYRFLLFTGAVCPCLIARFNPSTPNVATHNVEYLTPKVARVDLRQGAIPIPPADRKTLPLRVLLGAAKEKAATVAWKSHFWGTCRDVKFLQHLLTLPKLGDGVDQLSQTRGKRSRNWVTGQGSKPWSLNSTRSPDRTLRPFDEPENKWSPEDLVITPRRMDGQIFVPQKLCGTLREHFDSEKYSLKELYSKPPAELFTPPLVLFNHGFSDATFFDFSVRFQHSLQSIAGPKKDADKLIFLAAYLRSRLARYFVFHTSANIGMERDKVHLDEVLNLPFYLPGDPAAASPRAETLLRAIAEKFRVLKVRMDDSARKLIERLKEQENPKEFCLRHDDGGGAEGERKKWLESWAKKTAEIQSEIEPLLYDYFGLTDQEQALVEDTCRLFDMSDTPGSLDTPIPTLEPLNALELEPYAYRLANTLREWSKDKKLHLRVAGGVDSELCIAILKVEQANNNTFTTLKYPKKLAEALKRIDQSATTSNGSLVYLYDETWWFDGKSIYIAKPALRGRWTQTSAINDCAEIYAEIQDSRNVKA
ncbi:MAG TPA: N-6 DNA methylase, partial [Chthoniobacterales bacterium]